MSRSMKRSAHSLRIPGLAERPSGSSGLVRAGAPSSESGAVPVSAIRCGPISREAGRARQDADETARPGGNAAKGHEPVAARVFGEALSFGCGGEGFVPDETARFPIWMGPARTAKLSSPDGNSAGFRSLSMQGLWQLVSAMGRGCIRQRRKSASDAGSGGLPVALARRREASPVFGRSGRGSVLEGIPGEMPRGVRP